MGNTKGKNQGQPHSGEGRLSLIVESARLGWWDWNIETGELVWSKECLEMFGLPADREMSYARFVEAIHPEDRERVDEAVQVAIKSGGEYSTEMRAVWSDGSTHWILSRGRVFYDKAGKPVRMSGAGMDVTQFKETEESLRRARAEAKAQADNMAAIFDAMPAAAFFSNDRECRTMTSNRAAYELLRMPYGSNASMSQPEGERPTFKILENGRELAPEEMPVQKAAFTGEAVRNKEFEIRFEDGSSLYEFGHAVPLFDEKGEVRGAIGAFLDVTDRKVVEERLRAATERFRIALRNSPITVFNQGLDLRYRWLYNPAAGYAVADVLGKRDSEFLERREDAEKMEGIKSEVIRTGKSYQGEVEIHHQGKPRTYHVTIEPQRDPKNKIVGITCASFDLTDRKVAEEALRQSDWRTRQLIDSNIIPILRANMAGVLEGNDAFLNLVGCTREELEKGEVSWAKMTPPEHLEKDYEALEQMKRFGSCTPFEKELVVKGGKRIAILLGATVTKPDPLEWQCFVVDLTEQKRAQAELETAKRLLEVRVEQRTRELQLRTAEATQASEGLRELSSRLLSIQDEERRRIARELHDSAGQVLTALGLELAVIKEQARKAAPELLERTEGAESLVQQLHSEIRTTSYLLHPPLLDEAGLFSAVSWYARGITERSEIQVNLDMPPDFGRLPRDMELIVFRLLQESLTNIHRHSGSKTARIRLERDERRVTVEVHDEGKGMSPAKLAVVRSGGSGVGIRGMRERLHQLRGELRIESGEAGTSVFATIPIPEDGRAQESGIPAARVSI